MVAVVSRRVVVRGGNRVGSNAKAFGKTTPDEPTRTFLIALPIREVDSTIECGYQPEWGSIDEIDLMLSCGAGFGSAWATIRYGDKHYAIAATDLLEAFLDSVEGTR